MDFMERLKDHVNKIDGLPMKLKLGYLDAENSLKLYPLPGGKITREYYDGDREETLNYEIAIKTKNQNQANKMLWLIQTELERDIEIESQDGSFSYEGLEVNNKPFLSGQDEQGFFYYTLDISVYLTTYKR